MGRSRRGVAAVVLAAAAAVAATAAACGGGGSDGGGPSPVSPLVVPQDAGAACEAANEAADADAERLGYWEHTLTPDEQAEYFAGRAQQVDDLLAALEGMEPSPELVERWPQQLAHLRDYAAWARANVETVEASGSTVSEQSPASLEAFRAGFGLVDVRACADLFDMN